VIVALAFSGCFICESQIRASAASPSFSYILPPPLPRSKGRTNRCFLPRTSLPPLKIHFLGVPAHPTSQQRPLFWPQVPLLSPSSFRPRPSSPLWVTPGNICFLSCDACKLPCLFPAPNCFTCLQRDLIYHSLGLLFSCSPFRLIGLAPVPLSIWLSALFLPSSPHESR